MHGFLLVTALLTIGLLVYGLYRLNHRVINLEEKKRQMIAKKSAENKVVLSKPAEVGENIFHDLEGEALFYAIAGEYAKDLEFSDDARKRYELVLRKHILEVLEKAKDGERSLESEIVIRTLRGPVRSWLPEDVIGSLLVQGGLLAKNPNDKRSSDSIRATIDELYRQLGYESPEDLLSLEDDVYTPVDDARKNEETAERRPGADGFM